MNLRWLLIFIPIGLALPRMDANPILVFLVSALAIIPLSSLMGDATEALARYMGPTVGGLLNATLGNAPDIIIGFFALKKGLVGMVKASITGTILSNLLFGLGVSILLGGLKSKRAMRFDIEASHLHGGLLLLVTIGLIVPAVFNFSTASENEISLEIAAVLFLAYLVSLVYTLTNQSPDAENQFPMSEASAPGAEAGEISRNRALGLLLMVTLALAAMSEIMTTAVDPAARSLGFTPLFAGIFLLALVGNTAELINSVRFARRDQLDVCLGITLGGSTQTALLVAPLLVFFGAATGQEMNLLFSKFEVVAIILTVSAVINILHLGSVRWISGSLLIGVYLMLGVGFYYAPSVGVH